jgi:RNase P/RNase MRP subunit POP5
LRHLKTVFKSFSRYLLVEIIFGAGGGVKNVCSDSDIFQAVMRKVEQIHGEFGWASCRASFQVKVCDTGICIAILRIASDVVDIITSSLPFILSIGSTDAVLRMLGEGLRLYSYFIICLF